jgi:hypothetical protein
VLLNSLHSSEQVREQLALGWNSPLGGDCFKIARKVLRRDPRSGVGDLRQIACCSGRSTNDLRKRPVVDFQLLVV